MCINFMENITNNAGIITCVWMLSSICLYVYISTEINSDMIKFGPNDTLIIFDMSIDNNFKYASIIIFCFLNSMIRTINTNILQPWIINNIQDTDKITNINIMQGFKISYIYTIYVWFDFFIYMNIVFSQVDILLFEILADLIMITIVTKYYMTNKNASISSEDSLVFSLLSDSDDDNTNK